MSAAQALGSENEYLVFSMGDDVYAVDVLSIDEVLRMTWLTPIPEAPQDILGMLNRRGMLIPTIDVGPRLRSSKDMISIGDYLMVFHGGGRPLAIRVDGVQGVMGSTVAPTPANAEAPAFIVGHFVDSESTTITVLDLPALLSPEARQWIEKAES